MANGTKANGTKAKGEGFRNPHGLPTKICPVCGRPFTWRKKWARDWDQVVYCSEGCRRTPAPPPPILGEPDEDSP